MRGLLAKLLGERGERAAAKFLRRQGFQILARQHRTPFGEIDLVCREGRTIVFVEIKTRRSDAAGRPEESLTLAKQKQLTNLALAFLKRRGWLDQAARFDVVSVVWRDGAKSPEIEHFRNAFEPVGTGQMFA